MPQYKVGQEVRYKPVGGEYTVFPQHGSRLISPFGVCVCV